SISRAFVRLMGGEIEVRTQVGEGSVFSFAILAKAVSGQISKQSDRLLLPAKLCRCLIATEDQRDRQLLSTLLHSDFDIRTVNHTQAVVELWKLWQPQLIWIDAQMLMADGTAVMQQIRLASPDVPPVILAIGKDEARSIALSAGCDQFLSRPLHETQIRVTISQYQCLSRHHAAPAARPVDLARLRSQLALLSSDWISNLHQAALEGDLDRMLALIEEIRPQHPHLAEAIASLATSFQYVQLLTLTQPSDSSPLSS
ncbi:MAG: response regulator, partial [Microcoleus sp. SIO2G3]|nr:response regulator [Microcoleus sp. SIO2G3]